MRIMNIPAGLVRKAARAGNLEPLFVRIERRREYNYHGALLVALQIRANLNMLLEEPDTEAYPLISPDEEELSALRGELYLMKAGEVFPAVIFPEDKKRLNREDFQLLYYIFKSLLSFFNEATRKYLTDSWESRFPFEPIDNDELKKSDYAEEYKTFLKYFRRDGIYELMKMSQEFLGFTTLNHVLGVHAIAMKIGRQLAAKGFNIDLAVVSATAINHDVGKFGCKGEELKRIAYLHYYYTKEWFDRYKMDVLSHVATNHGTWDLESVRLPIETMLLIYSDFSVKNKRDENGKYRMAFFAIDDAFEVIKNMLDNLDEAKQRRYESVYEKLKDLDDLFSLLGIDRNIDHIHNPIDRYGYQIKYDPEKIVSGAEFGDVFALLPSSEIAAAFKNLSVVSNFRVLYYLRDVKSLSHILEQARLEKNWKDLRTYLRIIEGYSEYFTHDQRLITVDFLFELLSHHEDDIRYHASNLIAELIKNMDVEFHKEVPPGVVPEQRKDSLRLFRRVLELLNYEESESEESLEHKERRIYNTTLIIHHLFLISPSEKLKEYKKVLLNLIPEGKAFLEKPFTVLYLAEIFLVTISHYTPKEINRILLFALNYLGYSFTGASLMILNLVVRMMETAQEKLWSEENRFQTLALLKNISGLVKDNLTPAASEIIREIFLRIDPDKCSLPEDCDNISERLDNIISTQRKEYHAVFLNDFKTRTSWVEKKSNCDFLTRYAIDRYRENGDRFLALETAGHFANLLKVSHVEGTRFRAGQRLLELVPLLEVNQVNEIAIELLRSLEQDDEGFTQYIPRVLSRVVLLLPPEEFREIIDDIFAGLKSLRITIKELLLKTLGNILRNMDKADKRLRREASPILGMVLKSTFDTEEQVSKSAYNVIGSILFKKESDIPQHERRIYLQLIGKKFLTLLRYRSDSLISLFYTSSCLNQIYKFISSQEKSGFPLNFDEYDKIAFAPGTYDPFSNGHRELARIAAEKGYEVFIQVDEYSWSKRTLPRLLRKHIVRMAVADLFHVYLYPGEPPLNIANPQNLAELENKFDPRPVSLVVGTDVIFGASAYRTPSKEGRSVFDFHHLVFVRQEEKEAVGRGSYSSRLKGIRKKFRMGYEEILLDKETSLISSSRIRELIERNKPIDDFVDPVVAHFIEERRLYIKTPEYKSELSRTHWGYRVLNRENIEESDFIKISELYRDAFRNHPARSMISGREIADYFKAFLNRKNAGILVLENRERSGELIGFISYFEVETIRLLALVQSAKISEEIRERTAGPLVYSNILAIKRSYQSRNIASDIKTRAALEWIENGYMFALSKLNLTLIESGNRFSAQERRLLELNEELGYQILGVENEEKIGANRYRMEYMIVNLQRPVLLIDDLIDQFKYQYRNDKHLLKIIHRNQKLLLSVFRNIYPDQLLLRINNRDLINSVLEKIHEISLTTVTRKPAGKKQMGEIIALLTGQVLGREIVPNTVTKALHTERTVDRVGKRDFFMPYPYYTGIRNQLGIMKNFGKDPVLADLFSLSGATLLHLVKEASEMNFPIKKVVVGIISGKARELILANNIRTEHVIYLPTLTNWFNLRHFYPFIGGETIHQPFYYRKFVIESMNYIFPYRRARQLRQISRDDLISLSRVCLLGSLEVFEYLEDSYLMQHKRELTMLHLPEIMEDPRRPVSNEAYEVDWNSKISDILKGDLEQLERFYG